jgi:hypothetical protein
MGKVLGFRNQSDFLYKKTYLTLINDDEFLTSDVFSFSFSYFFSNLISDIKSRLFEIFTYNEDLQMDSRYHTSKQKIIDEMMQDFIRKRKSIQSGFDTLFSLHHVELDTKGRYFHEIEQEVRSLIKKCGVRLPANFYSFGVLSDLDGLEKWLKEVKKVYVVENTFVELHDLLFASEKGFLLQNIETITAEYNWLLRSYMHAFIEKHNKIIRKTKQDIRSKTR